MTITKKTLLAGLIGFSLLIAVEVSAQETSDLPEPGLTPQSRFYFLDRAADWLRLNVLTFNSVQKTELKAKIAEERLSELNNLSEKGAKPEVMEKLEKAIEKQSEEISRRIEKLNSKNIDVFRLVEKHGDFNLKRQRVLENVLEKVPEEARDKVEAALNNVFQRAEKSREVLLKQVDKGLISEEKAKEIAEKQISRLKEQLEKRIEKAGETKDEPLKERLQKIKEKRQEPREDAAVKMIKIIAKQWSFEPAEIRVKKGDKVVLIIKSLDVKHGFSLPEFGLDEKLESGKETRIEFKADKAGTFTFRCSVFCGQGHSEMAGVLIVEE